jgi:biopolymer transport protein ExbB/TolQ
MTSTFSIALLQSDPGGFAFGDFWSLTQQAGPLRWPIYFVLGFGLVQVFLKLYEFVRDRRVSRGLDRAPLASMSLPQIISLVEEQEASMLASLQSTMLNVFQTRPGEGLLHDEISNFVSFQQDQFAVFQRRMEFLSDTAGALGLMGTVWGMFTVFFQGSAEQDVILRGMGIALITTLLGLVVSIILNLSATELSTFFSKRVEQVSRKSDELRFRLMELAPDPEPIRVTLPPAVTAQAPIVETDPAAPAAPAAIPWRRFELEEEQESPAAPVATPWRHFELEETNGAYPAGSVLEPLKLVVRDPDGAPASGVAVLITVVGEGGSLDDGSSSVRATSDEDGRVGVSCTLPERAGTFEFDASVPDQPGPPTRLRLSVGAGAPAQLEAQGNHQAAVAGMRLPLPLTVCVVDRFGNPVPEAQVDFRVTHGSGKLGSGSSEFSAATDSSGVASTPFVVSSEAGPNRVEAVVEGAGDSIEFTAFGTEV